MLRTYLKIFLTVCEEGSFSKAADRLYLTPSAVLQQVRKLEDNLGASLFLRTSKGVVLTPAAEHLKSRGRVLIQLNEEIHHEISMIATVENQICVGTSIMEKCRLLYDLWVLFAEEEKKCEIQMVNIDSAHHIPGNTDLIESVNSGVDWMREWDFFEICREPLAFALVKDHPLAEKKMLKTDDLQKETVVTINSGTCDSVAGILDLLRKNHIAVTYHDDFTTNLLWGSAFQRNALLVPQCWSDILINMTVIPFEEEFLLPYGIFYRAQPRNAARKFMEFILATYQEGNNQGVVPILT